MHIRVTSAIALETDQVEKLTANINSYVNGESYTINYIVDSSIIGGIIVDIDGTVYDSSISKRLSNLRKNML